MGNTLSVVFSTSLLVLLGRNSLFEKFNQHGTLLENFQKEEIVKVITMVEHTGEQLKTFPADQKEQFLHWIEQAFLEGFSVNMKLGAVWTIISTLLIIWGVKRLEKKSTPVPPIH